MSNFTPTEILNKIGALNKIEKVESLDREHVEFYLKQEYRYVPSKYKMFLMYNDEIYYFSSDDDFEDVALEILYAGFDFDGDVDIEDYYEVSYISQNPRTKAVCSPDPKYCAGLTKVYGTLYTKRAKNLTQAIRSLYSQPFFKKYPPSLVSCYSYPEYFVSWNFDSFFERNKNTAAKMDEFLWRFYHTLRIDSKEDGYLFEPVNPYRLADMMNVPYFFGYFDGDGITEFPIILDEDFPVIRRYPIETFYQEFDMEFDGMPESS